MTITGHEPAPNGMILRDYIFGWDLRNHAGFESFTDALSTLDYRRIPYGSLWLIRGEVFRLVKVQKKPVFDYMGRGQ
jgi:hypothetical protein